MCFLLARYCLFPKYRLWFVQIFAREFISYFLLFLLFFNTLSRLQLYHLVHSSEKLECATHALNTVRSLQNMMSISIRYVGIRLCWSTKFKATDSRVSLLLFFIRLHLNIIFLLLFLSPLNGNERFFIKMKMIFAVYDFRRLWNIQANEWLFWIW